MNTTETATFTERTACINCGGAKLVELSAGRFDEGAVQRFIADDPWGEHPAPFLRGKPWSFVSCQDCGMAFHRHILDPEWNERRFSKWMSHEAIAAYVAKWNTPANQFIKATSHTTHVLRIDLLTRALRGSGATRVLDFGCGYGEFLAMCSHFGFEAWGVDRSSAKLDNNSYAKVFPEIEDITDKAPFHALTLFEVLEHLDDPRALLGRLRDLLVGGGILVLETPDCTGVRAIETRYEYDKIHPLEHINAFTPETLQSIAVRLGFQPIRKPSAHVTCDSTKIVKTMAKRVLAPVLKKTTQMYFRKG